MNAEQVKEAIKRGIEECDSPDYDLKIESISGHVMLYFAEQDRKAEEIRQLLIQCRPAVKAYLEKNERILLNIEKGELSKDYKAIAERDASLTFNLIEKIDAIILEG